MDYFLYRNAYLEHHGILNQQWGVRHGPPYPLKGGAYEAAHHKKYQYNKRATSTFKKKHYDSVIRKDKDTLQTFSHNPDRTKDSDMFYATFKFGDKLKYGSDFNSQRTELIRDENGKVIGSSKFYKYRIRNKVASDMKVASEDSGVEAFLDLYKNNRDFYNFVTDVNRMRTYFTNSAYKFSSYRSGAKILAKMGANPDYVPSSDELSTVYRLFNYVIPYDGRGSDRRGHDVAVQRAKFFKKLSDKGYGAVLDTNDALYGGYKASAPVIVFDVASVVPESVYQTKTIDKKFSQAAYAGYKMVKRLIE